MDGRSCFVVESPGRTATQWLTRCLNAHPDIYCSHGPELTPLAVDPSETREERAWRQARELDQFKQKGLDGHLDELLAGRSERCVGNIHGHAAPMPGFTPLQPVRPLHVAVIVRHPVAQLDSLARHMVMMADGMADRRQWIYDSLTVARTRYPDLLDAEGWRDVGDDFSAAQWVVSAVDFLDGERMRYQRRHRKFRTEQLTSDRDALLSFVTHLTGGVDLSEAYEQALDAISPVDQTRVPVSAVEIYHGWSPLQRRVFSQLMPRADARLLCGSIGYDVGFLE